MGQIYSDGMGQYYSGANINHQRLLESIGDIPPAEAEQRYYQALATPAAEAVLL
ncbi:hypothetical protein GCM10009108_11660 [Castellaniella ginsengisoli]|uniref:Uncharacterized protein n=1 Tax=Castellaniella ginsengisoli TaxID=546114 RepID=A0ABN1KVD4_9BURK